MLKPFSLFYKQIGIRRISDLLSVSTVDMSIMPQNTVLHYISEDPEVPEVDLSKRVFSTYSKKIHVRWISQYDNPSKEGYHSKPFNTITSTNKWFSENRSRVIRAKVDIPLAAGKDVLNIFNYSYLDTAYRYVETPLTKYSRFINTYSTIFSTMAKYAKDSIDEHFLEIHIGQELPSRTMLNMYTDKVNTAFISIFNTDYKMLILELWKWLDPNIRHTSILNVFSTDVLPNIVFIFTNEQNKSVYLSLAYMNNWIKGQEVLKEAGATQLPAETMQKVFLKFLISLVSTIEDDDLEEGKIPTDGNVPNEDTIHSDDEQDEDALGDKENRVISSVTSSKGTILRQNTIKSIKDIDDDAVDAFTIDDQLKDMEDDLVIQEIKAKKELRSKGLVLSKSLDVQEVLVKPLNIDEIKAKFLVKADPISLLRAKVEELGDSKDVSAADYRTMLKRIDKSQTIPNPYNSATLIKDTDVVPADVILDEVKISIQAIGANNIVDPSMSRSSLNSFTPDYVSKVLRKEVVSMVKSFTQAGVLIKSYEVEEEHSALGSYEKHRIELQPLQGVTSPIHIRLPIVNENGEFLANGNKYSMRAQRVDIPIRKIEPSTVALTSYYGKTFVGLSERKARSQIAWICTKLYQMSHTTPEVVKEVAPADVYNNYNKAPFLYNALAKNFRILKIDDLVLNFSYKDRLDPNSEFGKNGIPKEADEHKYVCGYTVDKKPIALDYENRFHVLEKGIWVQRGSIFRILGLFENDAPMDHSSINIFSKPVPVALVLAYRMGLHNLLSLLQSKYGLQYRFVEGKRLSGLEDSQYSIRFEDGFLVIDKGDRAADFIMAGLVEYEKETKKYPIKEFYHKHVYLNLLKSKGLSNMYLNEIDNLFDMFIDPITLRILQEMKEPETLEGLLLRATEMLKDYEHPDSQDFAYQRIRGYERFAGVMYNEIAKSIRTYRSKTNKTRSKIDMSPFQVWQDIMKDPANKLVEDINPIQNVKHQEIVTYVGVGGRDKGTINKKSRAFHINDIGVISEATVDSSDVGINTYMSCDPKLASMYGVGVGQSNVNSTNTLSSSAMLAPGSTFDDAKRVGFVSIQQSHTIAAKGYHAPIVRTGYEYVIGHRTTDVFCATAKQDGVVKSINDKGVIVEYKDGTLKGVQLGTIYGKAEGSNYPHPVQIHPHIRVGQKFNKGQVLAYNSNFFEQDLLYPSTVIMKNSMDVLVAYVEDADVHEDSCSISPQLATKLSTKTTYVRLITLDFIQEIGNVVKIGTKVMPDTPLMIIQDEITSSGSFDEKAYESLRRLSSQSPRSKYKGVVEKIEVFYHGEKDDMSLSIKSLADYSDKELIQTCKASNRPVINGRVNDDYRSEGVPLALDRIEIKIYITSDISAGVADKGVLCNQMKTTIGEVFPGDIYTEQGQKVDIKFSYRSVAKRIVNSPMLIGVISTISRHLGKVVGNMKE